MVRLTKLLGGPAKGQEAPQTINDPRASFLEHIGADEMPRMYSCTRDPTIQSMADAYHQPVKRTRPEDVMQEFYP